MATWRSRQLEMCKEHGASPLAVSPDQKVGIAANVRSGLMPIVGMRINPAGGTCGWYIYAGEKPGREADFYQPLHVAHLEEWCPLAMPFLLLPPGWVFITDGQYRDVYFDPSMNLSP